MPTRAHIFKRKLETNHDDIKILLGDILQWNLFDRNKISILQIQPFIDPTIRSFSNLVSQHLHQKKKKKHQSHLQIMHLHLNRYWLKRIS